MGNALHVLISGIEGGAVYMLMAVGLSFVYGVSRVFNYAYGSLITWAGYLAFLLLSVLSVVGYIGAFIVVIPVLFGLGFLMERALLKPLRRQRDWENTGVIVTLGFALVLNALALIIFGPFEKSLPPLFEGDIAIGDYRISIYRLVILVTTLAILGMLWLFLTKMRLGIALRAVSQSLSGARISGLPLDRLFGIAFAISAGLAGVSGILLGSLYLLSPDGGWIFFVKAFVIVALGGIGSLKGAAVAALILGIVEAAVSFQMGPLWVVPAWFLVLMIVLVVRPTGLFGLPQTMG